MWHLIVLTTGWASVPGVAAVLAQAFVPGPDVDVERIAIKKLATVVLHLRSPPVGVGVTEKPLTFLRKPEKRSMLPSLEA